MNISDPIEGKARKIFRLKGKDIKSDFPIGKRLRLIESIPNDEMSLERIALGILKAREQSGFILPALPANGQFDDFSATKIALKDAPRRFFVADVDLEVTDDLLSLDLRSRAKWWIQREGLPINTGFIAIWSSSAFKKGNKKLSIHIYFLLAEAYKEKDLRRYTRDLACDEKMCEKTRIHCVLAPTFDELWMLDGDYERYHEIVIEHGEPLDLKAIPSKTPQNIDLFDEEEDLQRKENQRKFEESQDTKALFDGWKEYFEDQGESVPWKETKRLAKASEHLLQNRRIKHRHQIHYWLMKIAYERTRDTYESMAEILNSRILLGNHEPKELLDQAQRIRQEFLDDSQGGDIREIFEPDEIMTIDGHLTEPLLAEDLDKIFGEQTITMLGLSEGAGKTHFVMTPALDRYDPNSAISITHRWNIAKKQSLDWGFEHGEDIGKDNPESAHLEPWEIKTHAWPNADNPVLTIQSLQYRLKNGKVKKVAVAIIDEIEHVMRELWLDPEMRGKTNAWDRHSKQFHALLEICNSADQVWLADASGSRDTVGWLITEIANHSGKKKRLLRNEVDYVSRMTFRDIPEREDAILTAVKLLNEGKRIAIITDHGDNPNKGKIDKFLLPIKKLAKLKNNEIYGVTGDIARDEAIGRMIATDPSKIKTLIDEGLKCLMISPVFDSGWSYHEDGNYRFDAVITILAHGLTYADEIKQMIRRFRLTTDAYIYMKDRGYQRKAG